MDKSANRFGLMLMAATGLLLSGANEKMLAAGKLLPLTTTAATIEPAAGFGIIRGFISDETGAPIAGALIAMFRDGIITVRQFKSAADGSFVARVAPGRYSLTAMAAGFSVVSLANVEVERAEDLAFRFNLVRTGSGNTLPERRADRNQPKWRTRSNQARRTIYQNTESVGATTASVEKIETPEEVSDANSNSTRRGQTSIETYTASSANNANYAGLNFATVQPLNENFNFVIAGQTGIGKNVPQRLEAGAQFKLNETHQISFKIGGAQLGKIFLDDKTASELNQISFQAVDEWRVRHNVILVIGMDYAQFINNGNSVFVAPRLGLQIDVDAKTRLSAALTSQNELRSWSEAADLEEARVLFRAPDSVSYAVADKQVLMPKMRRLEFGVERVLDNSSSVAATVFFDTISNRGVSFVNLPLTAFGDAAETNEFADKTSVGTQNGAAQGVRIVYSRRLNNILSAAAGYAAGNGQRLTSELLTDSTNLFENDFFQSVTAQLNADFDSGTQIRTVWRYSPRAAVFAIDPFAGRMAYYEPSLSILVTQNLPTWGLPLRAKAMFDAHNLFDLQTETSSNQQALRLNSNRRLLRGGIAVQF